MIPSLKGKNFPNAPFESTSNNSIGNKVNNKGVPELKLGGAGARVPPIPKAMGGLNFKLNLDKLEKNRSVIEEEPNSSYIQSNVNKSNHQQYKSPPKKLDLSGNVMPFKLKIPEIIHIYYLLKHNIFLWYVFR